MLGALIFCYDFHMHFIIILRIAEVLFLLYSSIWWPCPLDTPLMSLNTAVIFFFNLHPPLVRSKFIPVYAYIYIMKVNAIL